MFEKKLASIEKVINWQKEKEGSDTRLYNVCLEMLEIIKVQDKEIQKLKRCGCRRLKARE